MPQFLNFGSASLGNATVTGTQSPTRAGTVSGTAGAYTLTATGSFAAGQTVYISQERGTGAGRWEVNYVISYVPGTLTLLNPLDNTYTSSGANRAQAVVFPEYGEATVSSTLTTDAWDGTSGGICLGLAQRLVISSSMTVSGKGFRGGTGGSGAIEVCDTGDTGESPTGDRVTGGSSGFGLSPSPSVATNGSGGRGAQGKRSDDSAAGGGGAGYATAGDAGQASTGGANPAVSGGTAGTTVGSDATLASDFYLGSGGGGGGKAKDPNGQGGGNGGAGGGKILWFARELVITGGAFSNGSDGSNSPSAFSNGGGGGAGSGGSVLFKAISATLGTNLVLASGGAGGAADGNGGDGGDGGAGRIRVEACSINGSTNPTMSSQEGGHEYCSSLVGIY